MKKLILFLIFLFIVSSFYNSNAQVNNQFKWVHPKPQGNYLRWVKYFNANNWYAIGYGGTFMKTNNVGSTWTVLNNIPGVGSTGSNIPFYDAHFFDMNTGIVCGAYGKIARTTNGGASWNTMTVASSTWYDLYFINNNTGFVAGTSSNKVYKTTNKGLNWTSIGLTLTATSYGIYAWDVNNIIVSSTSGNVVKTTNGGATWTTINTGTTASLYKVNFVSPDVGMVAGASTAVRLTTNGGTTWTNVNSGLPSSTFYDIDFRTSGVPPIPCMQTFTSTNVTTINTGPGATYWDSVVIGTPIGIITDIQVGVDTLLHTWISDMELTLNSPSGAGVKFFDNRGGSGDNIIQAIFDDSAATPIASGSPPFTGTWIPDNPLSSFIGDTLKGTWKLKMQDFWYGDGGSMRRWWVKFNYVTLGGMTAYLTGNSSYIYKSTNLGATWSTIAFRPAGGQPVSSTMYSTDLASSGDALITVGAYGLFNERFNASTRIQYCNRQTTSTMYDVWGENGYGKVIAVGSSGNVLRSVNGGNTWTRANYSSSTWNSISMVNSNTGWVAGSSGRTFRTVNGGASFSEVTNTTASTLYEVVFANANTGWIFGSSGTIRRTNNAGSTWTTQTAPGVTSTIRGAHFINQYTGWLCGNSGKVSKTDDGGEIWTAQNPNSTTTLYDINMINENTGWLCGSSSTLRKTINGGDNWTSLTIPYTGVALWSVDFVDQYNGMVVGTNGRTFRTRNGGSSWEFENNSGATNTSVYLTSSDTGYVCGSYGNVFKYQESLTGVGNFTNEIPETYELHQNYPNPFNPTTTIKFALPEKGNVTLKVYDIAGRVVSTLFNNEGLNAGTFKYTFDGSSMASGIYFYSLVVDNKLIDTKKMMFLK